MYKGIAFLYFVCFFLYLLYTREPDFFDGETMPAIINWQMDSASQQKIPKAVYEVNKKVYAFDARYLFRSLPENKRVEIIYNSSHPERAALNKWWGYWITWGELLGSIILLIALFQVAVAVTKNPTAEAVLEQLEHKEEKKRRYDD